MIDSITNSGSHSSRTPEQSHAAIMGLTYNVYLNSGKIYGCKQCKTHLANHDDIMSRVSLVFTPSVSVKHLALVTGYDQAFAAPKLRTDGD